MEQCFICLGSTLSEEDVHAENKKLKAILMSNCGCNEFVHPHCLHQWKIKNPSKTNECPICRTSGTNFTLMEYRTPSLHHIPSEIRTSSSHSIRTVQSYIEQYQTEETEQVPNREDVRIYIPLNDVPHAQPTVTVTDETVNNGTVNNQLNEQQRKLCYYMMIGTICVLLFIYIWSASG